LQRVALSASSRTTCAVAEVLCKVSDFLHSRRGTGVTITHCAVDHVKACLALIQPQFEAGIAAPREVLRPPFNVEDAVGCSATDRGEYAEPSIDQIQVVPIREDRVVVGSPRQANVSKGGIGGRELRVAVGRQIDRGKGLVVQRVREWQRDRGDCIVPVIADVGSAWHDTAANLRYRVLVARRTRRCGCRCASCSGRCSRS
jgi:hypothetical protein